MQLGGEEVKKAKKKEYIDRKIKRRGMEVEVSGTIPGTGRGNLEYSDGKPKQFLCLVCGWY